MSKEKQEAPEVQEENIVKVSLKKEDLETVNKVDLSQEAESLEPEGTSEEAALEKQVEEVKPAIEEVTESETEPTEDIVEQAVEASVARTLPEGVEKLVEFISQTGGTVQDYVDLNRDYSEMDNLTALQEYYKTTKPHLSSDERAFLMEENFSFDEEIDDEKDIKRKKIALKEQVAEAKAYLDGQKSKYYEEIKAGSNLPDEAKKAMDFFNRYNEETKQNDKAQSTLKEKFLKKTDSVFNDKFKGFEYNVGDKSFNFNVKNASEVKSTQSDINNFVQKFLNEDGTMSDAKGYHKALHAAMNSDAIANHFYEQGKADALRNSVEKAKNVNMKPRQGHNTFEAGGVKFKVLGDDTASFKFKSKRK